MIRYYRLCGSCTWTLHGLALTGFTINDGLGECKRCHGKSDLALVKVIVHDFGNGEKEGE